MDKEIQEIRKMVFDFCNKYKVLMTIYTDGERICRDADIGPVITSVNIEIRA